MAPINARERRVRELIEQAINDDPNLYPFKSAERAARYVAEKLLDEIDALTKKSNAAIKLAAKGRK